ncbi:MAG: DNA-binding protein Alba [Aigarchaeota archaeon]|nr:DNA-binding protein Alba [Candidatus Pelearchaeum maunauluense]
MESRQLATTVLVGKKPIMNYVLACLATIQSGSNEVVIKARGRAISRAVDVVQILQNRFFKDLKVKDIKIGTEQVQSQTGQTLNVSTIEITVSR